MSNIAQNQGVQPAGPRVQVQEQISQLKPNVEKPSAAMQEASTGAAPAAAEGRYQAPQPRNGEQYLDPEQMRELAAKVAQAIRKASVEPHVVGFGPDPESEGYLIEIRKADGTLVTRFSPEKILNLSWNPDDLTGMVIDLKT